MERTYKGETGIPVTVTTDKPGKHFIDIGDRVVNINKSSSYYNSIGSVVGYDPTGFWTYRILHHDGYEWWQLASQVRKYDG